MDFLLNVVEKNCILVGSVARAPVILTFYFAECNCNVQHNGRFYDSISVSTVTDGVQVYSRIACASLKHCKVTNQEVHSSIADYLMAIATTSSRVVDKAPVSRCCINVSRTNYDSRISNGRLEQDRETRLASSDTPVHVLV
jgi:hypothetical protein